MQEAVFLPELEQWKRVVRWADAHNRGFSGRGSEDRYFDRYLDGCICIGIGGLTYGNKGFFVKNSDYELISYEEFLKRYIPEEYNGDKTMKDARKAINNLDINEDTLLLQEAGFENECGGRTDEGTEAILDLLYKEKRTVLIEKLKAAKVKVEADAAN